MKQWFWVLVLLVSWLGTWILFRPALAQEQVLNFYNFAEYIDPEIITEFEAMTGARVNSSFFESNEEMIAKLRAGGSSQYDVLVVTDFLIPTMANQDLLQPLDKELIPNIRYVSDKFIDPPYDPDNAYSLPYQWGTTAIGYRKDKLTSDFERSWSLIFEADQQQGPFVLIDDQRPMIGFAALYLGFDFNTTEPSELAQVQELLLETKRRSVGFIGGVGANNALISGNANVAVVYNTDVFRSQEVEPNLEFFIPEEGGNLWVDTMVISAQAPNPDLANEFVNFILDPEVGAKLSQFNRAATPNEESKPLLDPADLSNPAIYPDEEALDRLYFNDPIGGDQLQLIDALWTTVKSS